MSTPLPEEPAGPALPPGAMKRTLPLLGVIGMTLAVVGYVAGIRESARPDPIASPVRVPSSAPPAESYVELRTSPLSPNAQWHQSLADLKYDRPGIFDPVIRTEEMKLEALEDRSRNRAYDGAPPTIPHPVSTQFAAGCLACHGEGIKVGERVASKMSHAIMTNCTQCHVEQAALPVESSFRGIARSGPGDRASPGAPPTIPHHTWLRENCSSCHGTLTRPGTRTTHPWLTNCTQCHAPSAALNHVNFLEGRR